MQFFHAFFNFQRVRVLSVFPPVYLWMSVASLTCGLEWIKTGVVEYGDLLQVVQVGQVGQVIEISEAVVGEGEDDEAGGEILATAVQRTDAVAVEEQLLRMMIMNMIKQNNNKKINRNK